MFDEELKVELRESGYKQIHRNFLLTYAYAAKQGFTHFANVVISPQEDKLSVTEIEELRRHMTQYQERIFKIPLETAVGRGGSCGNRLFSEMMRVFKSRYLI